MAFFSKRGLNVVKNILYVGKKTIHDLFPLTADRTTITADSAIITSDQTVD